MKQYTKDLKRRNPEKAREWRQKAQRRYYQKHKDKIRAQVQRWRAAHPEAHRAHLKAEKAVKRGDLIKSSVCQRCGSTDFIQGAHCGHHYKEALKVEWLCVRCHRQLDGTKLEYRITA